MKKILIPILAMLLIAGLVSTFRYRLNKDFSQPVNIPTTAPSQIPSQIKIESKTSISLFVPYWTLPEDTLDAEDFERIIYFGIKPDDQGISMTEQEEEQIEKFMDIAPVDTKNILALRMINSEENLKILNDTKWQKKIIYQTIQNTKDRNMNGIALDLEISAIPFESLKKKINNFVSSFYDESKKNDLEFSLIIYGDMFYRARPFDIKDLAANADSIMIMAYDMHKARGNPGPNFPLRGEEKYGYDLSEMTDDFLKFVPADKITVIFGMFGYDWKVNGQGAAVGQGEALSLAKIKNKFGNYEKKRDKDSGETQILYNDSENMKHVVWFEDMESVKRKQEFLQGKGINSFSYWAYSYY